MASSDFIARLKRETARAIRELRAGSPAYDVSVKIDRVERKNDRIIVEGTYTIGTIFSRVEKGKFRLGFTPSLDELVEAEFRASDG